MRRLCLIWFGLLTISCVESLNSQTADAGIQSSESEAAQAQERKKDPVLGDSISEALMADGRLWLRGRGGLVSFDLEMKSRAVVFKGGVIDIAKIKGRLWVVRSKTPNNRTMMLSVLKDGDFQDAATFTAAEKDRPFVLFDAQGQPALLSPKSIRVFDPAEGSWHVIKVKGDVRAGVQISAASPLESRDLYVGYNIGEWGGGVQRVSLETGTIKTVSRIDGTDLCDGPLNPDCDPVTGLIPDPYNTKCVLASVGLAHMLSHGRILRICGDQVNLVFERPLSVEFGDRKLEMTEAFFGLAAVPNGYWAISGQALYHFEARKEPKKYAFPKTKIIDGICFSRDIPGVFVILTDVNWQVSVSGYTPLIVSTE